MRTRRKILFAVGGLLSLLVLAVAYGAYERPIHRRALTLTEGTVQAATEVEDVRRLFHETRTELVSSLDADVDLLPEEEFLLFATVFAYLSAPYGNSTTTELDQLLVEPYLDCDNYAALVLRLFEEYRIAENLPGDRVRMRIVGWHGGAVGNHAQLFAFRTDGTNEIFLDPTIAVVAFTTYDEVAAGKRVAADRIYDLSTRTKLDEFRAKVITALTEGRYRPLDLLYYFERPARFYAPLAGVETWPTPGGVRLRADMRQKSPSR